MQTIFAPTEVIQKWCAALRSGEYKQGQHRLLDGDGNYCCLGVLQMVLDGEVEKDLLDVDEEGPRALPLPSTEWLQEHNIKFYIPEDKESSRLEPSQTPHLPQFENSASGANDEGVSFVDLADAIEKMAQPGE